MFEGLKGRKFYNKCKSNLKLIKVRMEAIKKKRSSVQKYLKNDLADLLKESLDINAYGRAEGLIVEMNMSSCYAMIEQFCATILSNIATMEERECPKDCREAVPSLVYAAARFADLPELRDLRSLFFQKYGNSLEEFLSKEFVQKLTPEPPTKEEKIQLLRDIAQATSINWDSKALEQKLYTPPPPPVRSRTKIETTLRRRDELHASKDDYEKQQDSEGAAAALKVNKQSSCNKISNVKDYYTVPESQKEIIHNIRYVEEKSADEIQDIPQQQQQETKKPLYLGLFPRKSTTPPAPPADVTESQKDDDIKTEPAEHVDSKVDDEDKPKPKPRSVRSRRPAATNRQNISQRDSNTYQKDATECQLGGSQREPSALNPVKTELRPPPYLRSYGDGPNTARERGRGQEVKHFGGTFEPTRSPEANKRYLRGTSLDSETGFDCSHPRLPEYDDLAARIAALSAGK